MAKKPLLVAEIGQAHDGSVGMAHAYIDAVADAGFDIIKFQTHIASAESSKFEPFRVNFSYQDATRYDYWSRMSFSFEQWQGLKEHCDQKNIEFMSTPFSVQAVEWLEKLKVVRYKIGSGDTDNRLLLAQVAKTQKPIILSSGMSSYHELAQSIDSLKLTNSHISLLQCTTQYPTVLSAVGLNNIDAYRAKFSIPVGLSDHSGTVYPSLLAMTKGVCMIEVHAVFDKTMFGPDVSSSLTIAQLKELKQAADAFAILEDNPVDKSDNTAFNDLKNMFGRSLTVNKSLPEGHCISIDDLECTKPKGQGIDARDFERVIGKRLKQSMEQYSFINDKDLF